MLQMRLSVKTANVFPFVNQQNMDEYVKVKAKCSVLNGVIEQADGYLKNMKFFRDTSVSLGSRVSNVEVRLLTGKEKGQGL
jgi:hypothetical protein